MEDRRQRRMHGLPEVCDSAQSLWGSDEENNVLIYAAPAQGYFGDSKFLLGGIVISFLKYLFELQTSLRDVLMVFKTSKTLLF